jgi:hypothetical protein
MRPSSCDNPEHRVIGSGVLSSRAKSRSIRIGSSDGKPTVSSTGNSRPNKSASNANTSLSVLVLSESGTELAGLKSSKGGSSLGAQGAGSHGSNCNPSKSIRKKGICHSGIYSHKCHYDSYDSHD